MSNENELKLKHLSERERAVSKKLLAEMRLNKSPQNISLLRMELRDILLEAKEIVKRDEIEELTKKYDEDNKDLKEVQL